MERRSVTIFFVTDQAKAPRKIVVPLVWLKSSLVILVLLSVMFTAFGLDYFGLLLEAAENKRLRADNLLLKSQFQVVETKVTALESALERVKTFTTKLRLITNVDDENRGLKLSVTTPPVSGQQVDDMVEPIDQRPPVSSMEKDPTIPTEAEAPVNEEKGELAVQGQRDYSTLAIRIESAVKETQMKEQSVLDLWESLSERQALLNSTPSIKPARGWFTSKFGYRISPFTGRAAMHAGLDIAAAPGSPVYAPADGVVTFASYDESYGKLVTIDHGYGVMTRYGHNSQIYVQVGQRVSRWDVVAAVGNTGRSTGPHLHYEVRINNIPVDPSNYVLDE